MKLYQQLEQVFKLRLNSNSEIIPYIKKLSEMGKFDEPKKVAAIAIMLDRVGKLEDERDTERSLQDLTEQSETPVIEETLKDNALELNVPPVVEDTTPSVPEETKTVSEFSPEAIVDTPQETTSETT